MEAKSNLMLTDTGTTLTYLVGDDYDRVIEALCEGRECNSEEIDIPERKIRNVTWIENCRVEEFPSIWFKIDNHWYQFAPNAYLEVIGYVSEDFYACGLLIRR